LIPSEKYPSSLVTKIFGIKIGYHRISGELDVRSHLRRWPRIRQAEGTSSYGETSVGSRIARERLRYRIFRGWWPGRPTSQQSRNRSAFETSGDRDRRDRDGTALAIGKSRRGLRANGGTARAVAARPNTAPSNQAHRGFKTQTGAGEETTERA
jgi:hypothetical protein